MTGLLVGLNILLKVTNYLLLMQAV